MKKRIICLGLTAVVIFALLAGCTDQKTLKDPTGATPNSRVGVRRTFEN